jgi:hypothetical protein
MSLLAPKNSRKAKPHRPVLPEARATALAGSWIVEAGDTGGGNGGGTTIVPAPPVTINSYQVINRYNGTVEVDIAWTKDPTAGPANFVGVADYLEDPDISSGVNAPLDGSTPLNGNAQVGGAWQPAHVNNSLKSPAVLILPLEPAARTIRVYLCAYGPYTQAKPVRATDPSPSPNILVPIPAAPSGQSGMEHAFLVTAPAVSVLTDYDRPDPKYSLQLSYTPPDPTIPIPPTLGAFGACRIFYVPTDTGTDTNPIFASPPAADSGVDIPSASSGGFKTSVYDPSPQGGSFRCYFLSEDVDAHINTLVAGVTPYAWAQVPPVTALAAPDVTGFTISGQQVIYQLNGSFIAQADFSWNLPLSGRYAGVILYLVSGSSANPTPVALSPQQANSATNYLVQTANIPPAPENWIIAAISVNTDGSLADVPANYGQPGFHSLTVTWTVGPPQAYQPGSGQEHAPWVTINGAGSAPATQTQTAEGVQMVSFNVGSWTNPTDNRFGSAQVAMVVNGQVANATYWSVPGGQTSFVTPAVPNFGNVGQAVPVDFYIVSDDPQGKKNSIIGTTPKIHTTYTPQQSAVIPSRTGWFDPTQFAWDTSGQFQGQAFSASIIQVGSNLIVGGGTPSFGGQHNGQIAVVNASGLPNGLVGWIGTQQSNQGDGSTIYGAWFKQLWVGGNNPLTAPLFVDVNGIIEVGGIAAAHGAPYPYISIRNSGGTEMGRIGASLTSADPGSNVGGSPPSGLTAGAWFTQLAVGGSTLSNWQILVTPDSSALGSNVQMRNINLFTIDYPANSSPSGSNPEYRFDLGNSIWMAGGISGGYKFPGIHIYEVEGQNNFGATLLNRGLVLRGTATQGYPVLVNLTTYNGDSSGSDSPVYFYGHLVMNSPNSPYNPTIIITSGSNASDQPDGTKARMEIRDINSNTVFYADSTGVTTQNGYKLQGYNSPHGNSYVIDSGGNWVGQPISGTGQPQTPWAQDIAGASHNLSGVNNISCATLTVSGNVTISGTISGASYPFLNSSAAFIGAGVLCAGYGGSFQTLTLDPASGQKAISMSLAANQNDALTIDGKKCCDYNGTWSGNGVQCNQNIFGNLFGIFQVATGATGNNGGATAIHLTDVNSNIITVYLRGGILCSG